MSRADPNLKLLELASLESRKHGHFYKDEVSVWTPTLNGRPAFGTQ